MKPKQTRDFAPFLKKEAIFRRQFFWEKRACLHSQCCELFVGGLEISGAYFSRSIPRKSGCVAKLTSVCCGGIWPLSPDQRETVPTVSSLSSSSFSIPGGKYWHGFGRWRWTMKGTDIRQLVKGLYKLAKMRQPLYEPTKIFQELVKLVNVTLNLYSSASLAYSTARHDFERRIIRTQRTFPPLFLLLWIVRAVPENSVRKKGQTLLISSNQIQSFLIERATLYCTYRRYKGLVRKI